MKWNAGQACNFAFNWIKSKTSKLMVSLGVTRALSGLLKYDVVIHSKPNRRLDLRNFEYYYVLLQCQCFYVINARFDKLKKMWPFQTDDDQTPLTFISPRDRLRIMMLFNRYRNFHWKDKTVDRLMLLMEISIPRTMAFILKLGHALMCSLPKIIQLGQPYKRRYIIITSHNITFQRL